MGRWEIDQFELLLKCLEESGSLSSVVIIGSWAEWCYEESGILGPEYSFPLKTLDADVLIPRLGGDMAATPYSLGGGAETVEHACSAIHASPARTPPQRRRAR